MIRIKSIAIDGFKGHDSIEVSPKKINIVTGKNNVGKTSFLESINIAFQPDEVRNYEQNMDKLINAHKNKANIYCQFDHNSGQKSISEFIDDEVDTRDVSIEQPSKEQVLDSVNRMFHNRLPFDPQFELFLRGPGTTLSGIDVREDQLSDIVSSCLRESIEGSLDEYLNDTLLERFKSHSLILTVDGSRFHYIYRGEEYDELSNIIGQLTAESVNEEVATRGFTDEDTEEYDGEVVDSIRYIVEDYLRRVNRGRYGRGTFLEVPDTIDEVAFIDNLNIEQKDINNKDDYAIILTEIEDFLIENDIASNLRDFNLDMLVFEEGGERYTIPYEFMGDGFKSIVGLLWELKKNENESSVVLLEEPENHMHPGYIQKLVRFLIEISANTELQLFISTHNIDFISEFFNGTDEYSDYLVNNFQVIQIQDEFATLLPYDAAEENLNKLHLDLRGL